LCQLPELSGKLEVGLEICWPEGRVKNDYGLMNFNSHQHILDGLRSEFQAKAHRTEEMFLLSPEVAADFIERGIESGLRLVGIDGFSVLHTGCIQLRQEFSNAIDDCAMSYEEFMVATMDLIQAGSSEEILFDVVFDTSTGTISQ
jgi:hypothetical protein